MKTPADHSLRQTFRSESVDYGLVTLHKRKLCCHFDRLSVQISTDLQSDRMRFYVNNPVKFRGAISAKQIYVSGLYITSLMQWRIKAVLVYIHNMEEF